MSLPRRDLLLLAAVVLAGGALRFATLGVESLWLDESVTVDNVSGSLDHLFHAIGTVERTPPGYYLALWGWIKLFGGTPDVMRALSALVGTVTIPVAYLIALRLTGRRAALVTAVIVAVNPMLFHYSQELRAYGLMILLSCLSLLALLRAREQPSPRRLGLWSLASLAAIAVHYFSFFIVGPEAVLLLVDARAGRALRGRVLAAVVAVGAGGLALLPLLAHQRSAKKGLDGFPADTPLTQRVAVTVKQFLVGPAGPAPRLTPIFAGIFVLVALALLARSRDRVERRGAMLAAAFGIAAVLLPLALAFAGQDFYDARNVLPALVPAVIVCAAGFAQHRLGLAALVGLCAVSIAVISLTETDRRYQRDNWRGVAQALGVARGPRLIELPGTHDVQPLSLYRPQGGSRAGGGTVTVSEIDLAGTSNRQPGQVPSRPTLAPLAVPGFVLQSMRAGATYEVLRYVSSAPRRIAVPTSGSNVLEPALARPGAPG